MITVVTPFSRRENIELMSKHLEGKCNWILLVDDFSIYSSTSIQMTEGTQMRYYDKSKMPKDCCISNVLFNWFIDQGLDDETQYMILCDDDHVEEGFFDKIPDEDVVICSMKRGDRVPEGGVGYGWGDLIASPNNIAIGKVAGEQLIIKGKVLKNYRYGLSAIGDGEMIVQVVRDYPVTYVPDAYVLFNYLEEGRYNSFRRKPLVLFIGDYYCAGNPNMGKSEWEGNIAHSLDSTGLANVITFHFDKYYLTTGKRGDEALLERIEEIKPDYVVLIMYKLFGSDPTVLNHFTFLQIALTTKIIMIWGDLEAKEQIELSNICLPNNIGKNPGAWKMIGTANKSVVESLGYTYMHVPKDSRIFNNPNMERDIDVIFYGSYGYGREERRGVLQYLLDNGIKLVAGGSEGGDHYTTEEYAEGYKRAKIAISFSQARGMNVVNARPFEVMSCGAMLLEQKSEELAKLYEEGVDYDVWITKEDLLEKVRYYLANEEERKTIANNGWLKTEEKYSALTFWQEALK